MLKISSTFVPHIKNAASNIKQTVLMQLKHELMAVNKRHVTSDLL